MFDTQTSGVGLLSGESDRNEPLIDDWLDQDDGFDELVYQLTETAWAEIAEEADDGEVSTRQVLPDDLDRIPPGPYLAAVVDWVERCDLNGYDLVQVMQAGERLVSHYQAGVMADAVEISYCAPGDSDSAVERIEEAFEFASDEIRAALTLTRSAANRRLSLASGLCERLPAVFDLLDEGLVDLARARIIVEGTDHLDETAARKVVERVIPKAGLLTTGQLAALIRKLCVDTDPQDAKKRYETAVDGRRIWIEQTVDGTGNVHLLDIPIATAAAIGRTVNGHMISLKNDGDQRAHDQLRADILCDLILRNHPTGSNNRGLVDIRVDLTTLAGLDNNAAELLGMGPVIADIARKVAASQQQAEWRITVTDHNGEIILADTTRRRPTAAQTRQIHAQHPTCVFPGCRIQAEHCDLDHNIPWAQGGPTTVRNINPKCRHDHILKNHGWTHQYHNGRHIWTSPLGHTYITTGQSP
ncbi:MAG: DUF222 domain-containing protein [Acidimicrobiia bacterium]